MSTLKGESERNYCISSNQTWCTRGTLVQDWLWI